MSYPGIVGGRPRKGKIGDTLSTTDIDSYGSAAVDEEPRHQPFDELAEGRLGEPEYGNFPGSLIDLEALPESLQADPEPSLLRVRNAIHDRLQLESNITFNLRPKDDEESERRFKIDMYLYLPYAVGLSSSNFSAQQFFRHWTSYFRVRAPQFHHLRVLPAEQLRFDSAEAYFRHHLDSLQREKLAPKVIQDARLFGTFLYTDLKKIKRGLPKKRKSVTPERARALSLSLIHRVGLIWAVRERYLNPIRNGKVLVDEAVQRAFFLTDEYLSYRAEIVLVRAAEQFEEHSAELRDLLAREMAYRERWGLLKLDAADTDTRTYEMYTYRLGLLKKYLGEALFLQLKSAKKDRLYRNYAAAIGAGLAATVAGLAEHQRIQYLTGNDSGLRLAFLIGVAVVAYIFKDRVKDLTKEYFNSRMKERLPDQRFTLHHESVNAESKKEVAELGVTTEYVRFLKEIPPEIEYLRTLSQHRASDPMRRERVLHVARRFDFQLRSESHGKLFPLLKNVVRLDISQFLSKLGDPTVPVRFYGPSAGGTTVQAPKVYHLNVIFRYETIVKSQPQQVSVDYEKVRLVIDKNGIVRLEKVVPTGRFAYRDKVS